MRLPGVELVHHIPMPEHPAGRYVKDRRRIELSRAELRGFSRHEREFTVYHELGHFWHCEMMSELDLKAFSFLGHGNAEEGFADAFAFYFLDPTHLHRAYPDECELVEAAVGPHGPDVRTVAEAIMVGLDAGLADDDAPLPKKKRSRLQG